MRSMGRGKGGRLTMARGSKQGLVLKRGFTGDPIDPSDESEKYEKYFGQTFENVRR